MIDSRSMSRLVLVVVFKDFPLNQKDVLDQKFPRKLWFRVCYDLWVANFKYFESETVSRDMLLLLLQQSESQYDSRVLSCRKLSNVRPSICKMERDFEHQISIISSNV